MSLSMVVPAPHKHTAASGQVMLTNVWLFSSHTCTAASWSGHVDEGAGVLVPHDGRRAAVRVRVVPVAHVAQRLRNSKAPCSPTSLLEQELLRHATSALVLSGVDSWRDERLLGTPGHMRDDVWSPAPRFLFLPLLCTPWSRMATHSLRLLARRARQDAYALAQTSL